MKNARERRARAKRVATRQRTRVCGLDDAKGVFLSECAFHRFGNITEKKRKRADRFKVPRARGAMATYEELKARVAMLKRADKEEVTSRKAVAAQEAAEVARCVLVLRFQCRGETTCPCPQVLNPQAHVPPLVPRPLPGTSSPNTIPPDTPPIPHHTQSQG